MRGGVGGQALCGLFVLLVLCPTGSSASNAYGELSPFPAGLMDHGPISIEGDSNFTPDNGVTAGTGTPDDPFVIARWRIELTGPPGINVQNTRASFVIRDIDCVSHVPGTYDAVVLQNVTDARVENVTTEDTQIGVVLFGARSATVVRNQLRSHQAIQVYSSEDVTIAGNDAVGGIDSWGTISVDDSTRVVVESNHLTTGHGVSLIASRSEDLEVLNNSMSGHGGGIIFDRVTGGLVASNNATWEYTNDNNPMGFDVRSSRNVSLIANRFDGWREDGIDGSANITLDGNRFTGYLNDFGVSASRNLTMMNNVMEYGGLWIGGTEPEHYTTHRIDVTNLVAGRPIGYFHDCVDTNITGATYAQVIVVGCHRVRVADASFANVTRGIHVALSDGLTVENVQAIGVGDGVLVEASANITVANVTVSLSGSGIHVVRSQAFSIRDSRVRGSFQEIDVFSSTDGEVAGNELARAPDVGLAVQGGHRVQVWRNVFTANSHGMIVDASEGVRVYHNEFLGNGIQAQDSSATLNSWDDGYPSGGNIWSDYRGFDDCSGPAQDVCPSSDGLGDMPYSIPGGASDRYPLLPFNPPNAPPVVSLVYSETAYPGAVVPFDASASYDPEGYPLRYTWDFGDGTHAEMQADPRTTHAYATPGLYRITLNATDVRHATTTATGAVRVAFLALQPYEHPSAGFRLPIPSGWTIQENARLGETTVDLLLLGPTNGGVQTNILVASDEDPRVREDGTYLRGLVNATLLQLRQSDPSTSVDLMEGPTLRTIGGHAAVTFKLQYGTGEAFQKIAIVASELHRRVWLLDLTTDGQSYPAMDEAFERMLAGFEITLTPPNDATGPNPATPELMLSAILLIGAVVGAAIAVLLAVLVIRSRRQALVPPVVPVLRPAPVPAPPTSSSEIRRFCPACGNEVFLGMTLCGRCGSSIPPDYWSMSPGSPPGP